MSDEITENTGTEANTNTESLNIVKSQDEHITDALEKVTDKTAKSAQGSDETGKASKSQKESKGNNLKSDAFFKRVMENKLAAVELLDHYLPVEVKTILDLDTVKVEKESYVSPELKRNLSDIVYSVHTKDKKEAFIYVLCEHLSTSDYWIGLRLFEYMLQLISRHKKGRNKLPLVIPICIYAGKKKYSAPRNLWDLFDNPELARKSLTDDYNLIDLQAMSDDEIIRKKKLALFEYTMKNIQIRDALEMLRDMFKLLQDAISWDRDHEYFYIKNIVCYTDTKVPEEKKEEFAKLINENLQEGEEVMRTIADSYIDEGIAKGVILGKQEGIVIGKQEGIVIGKQEGIEIGTKMGIEQGIEQGIEKGVYKTAINMLKEKIDPEIIKKVTGLTTEEILKLKNKGY